MGDFDLSHLGSSVSRAPTLYMYMYTCTCTCTYEMQSVLGSSPTCGSFVKKKTSQDLCCVALSFWYKCTYTVTLHLQVLNCHVHVHCMFPFRERNVMFREYLRRLEKHKRCQHLSMMSFLLLPMQRITRLPLLILAILNKTPLDHEDHGLVENSLRTVQKVYIHVYTFTYNIHCMCT